jgi:hypothetical protein
MREEGIGLIGRGKCERTITLAGSLRCVTAVQKQRRGVFIGEVFRQSSRRCRCRRHHRRFPG